VTADELKAMLADALSGAAIEKALESREAAREAQGKAALKPADVTPELIKAVNEAGTAAAPKTEKGIDFARVVLAFQAAKQNGGTVAQAAQRLGYTRVAKSLSEGSFADGGALVHDQISSEFLDVLRPGLACLEMGMREIPFKGSMTIGRQNSAATAAWMGEAVNITPSSPTFGELQLQAKKLGAGVAISNEMLRNPSTAIEAKVRDDLSAVMARKLDLALLEGLGTAYSPRGLDSWVNSANQNAITGTGLSNKVDDLGRAIRLVEAADVPFGKSGWVLHPRTKWALATTLDSQGNFVFMPEIMSGRLFGHPFKTTTAMTISGSNYKLYFGGAWEQYLLGVDTQMSIESFMNAAYYNGTSVVAGASSDESFVRAIGRFDSVLCYDKAFSITTGVSY
jgi:HK97 family phage major capsid protein